MSTLRVNNLTDTSGTAANLGIPGAAKAWVNFNGQGTVAIRDSYNVSSITDNGTGNYTINFTTAMSNSNYSVQTMQQFDQSGTTTGSGASVFPSIARQTDSISTTSVSIMIQASDGVLYDAITVTTTIFSN